MRPFHHLKSVTVVGPVAFALAVGCSAGTASDATSDADEGLGGARSGDGDTDSDGADDGGDIEVDDLGEDDGDLVECAESEANAELVPANLLFVVDKSGSMNCNAPPLDNLCLTPAKKDPSEPSKWEITQQALTGENGALPILSGQAGVSVGMLTFPTDDFCAVPEDNVLTVPMNALDEPQLGELQVALSMTADGQTPLAGAAIRGLNALRSGIDSGKLKGDNYLVLMTDGAETCQVGALGDLLWFVEQANYYYGIRTYAIGAPGSEASRDLLSEVAILGGTRKNDECTKRPASASESCHVDLTESTDFETELGQEFQGITEEAAQKCEYNVPSGALVDPKKVNVEFTPNGGESELVPQDPRKSGTRQCQDADGWQFTSDGSKIVLCGKLCETVLADPSAEVRVVFGCRDTVVR